MSWGLNWIESIQLVSSWHSTFTSLPRVRSLCLSHLFAVGLWASCLRISRFSWKLQACLLLGLTTGAANLLDPLDSVLPPLDVQLLSSNSARDQGAVGKSFSTWTKSIGWKENAVLYKSWWMCIWIDTPIWKHIIKKRLVNEWPFCLACYSLYFSSTRVAIWVTFFASPVWQALLVSLRIFHCFKGDRSFTTWT